MKKLPHEIYNYLERTYGYNSFVVNFTIINQKKNRECCWIKEVVKRTNTICLLMKLKVNRQYISTAIAVKWLATNAIINEEKK